MKNNDKEIITDVDVVAEQWTRLVLFHINTKTHKDTSNIHVNEKELEGRPLRMNNI